MCSIDCLAQSNERRSGAEVVIKRQRALAGTVGAAVLVAVRYCLLNDLEGFLGGPAYLLLPQPMAIANWAEAIVAQDHAQKLRL